MKVHGEEVGGSTRPIAVNTDGTLEHKPVKTWTGDISDLAISITGYLDVDLGEEWHQYTILSARKVGLASAGEILAIHFSVDGGASYQVAAASYNNNAIASNGTSNSNMAVNGRVHGRHVRLKFVNGATQQNSGAMLYLTAAPY